MSSEQEERLADSESLNGKDSIQEGVFVYVKHTDKGIQIAFELVGGYDPLAVPILLELAKGAAREHVGLNP